jgi:hypothetical protein
MIAICRTHYASTLVARGRWQEAEREFQAAIAGFGHPHRGQAAEAQVRLAELLVRQGRLDEAAELLDSVDAGAGRMLGHTIAPAGLRTLADLVRTEPMLAAARLAQGAVAHAFADPAAARAALLDAVALFTAVDAPYERAQALLLLAPMPGRHRAGSRRHAHAAEALGIAHSLGARSLGQQARDLLAELGTSPAPGSGHVRRTHQP